MAEKLRIGVRCDPGDEAGRFDGRIHIDGGPTVSLGGEQAITIKNLTPGQLKDWVELEIRKLIGRLGDLDYGVDLSQCDALPTDSFPGFPSLEDDHYPDDKRLT